MKKTYLFCNMGLLGFFNTCLPFDIPWGTLLFFFSELWINKFCSFLKAALLEKLAKASVNCLCAAHVVWITSLLMFSGVTRSCTGVSFFSVPRSARKNLFEVENRDPHGMLSLLKSRFIYPVTILVMPLCSDFPLYCKASKPNLENNDYIVHVSTGL